MAAALLAVTAAGCASRQGTPAARPATGPAGSTTGTAGATSESSPRGAAPRAMAGGADRALGEAFAARFEAADALALWSVRLERAGTRDVLATRNAARLVLPASNMKIVTLAATAARLGWDYRFRTTLHARGERAGHTLRGDLVVVGGADPTIGRGTDPLATFRDWARRLRAQGLRRIEGDIVGDPTRFGADWLGDSWSWDDLPFGYAAPYSGLIFHENVVRVRVTPGTAAGLPPAVRLWPVGYGLDTTVDVHTAPAGTTATLTATRALGSSVLDVRGTLPAGGPVVERLVSVSDPARYFVGALRAAFAEEGLEVRGSARVGTADATTLGAPLLVHESSPLSDVAQRFMKVSQNLYGEVFLRLLAAQQGGATSTAAARAALQQALDGFGVPTGTVQGLDGSGLSRRDFVTAEAIATLLQAMARPPHRETFRATLPVAATDGTLANRFKGNACAGRLFAKTGTLAHARALSGYIASASGHEYVFSVIANNFLAPPREIDAIVEEALGIVCAS